MMNKPDSTPAVASKTWRALIDAATDFAALEPWKLIGDVTTVGLIDPATNATRIGQVLGNAGEVFAAVFYRRVGIRWILDLLGTDLDPHDPSLIDGMDCLKVEFVPKH